MNAEEFVAGFVAKLRVKATELQSYGATEPAQTCGQIASDLAAGFRGWRLAELTVSDAAEESGYSQERLRELARDGELPHKKGNGHRGRVRIARCDLPRRPKPKSFPITSLEERLLRPRHTGLREGA